MAGSILVASLLSDIHKESSLLAMLTRYIGYNGYPVNHLMCNGAFSLCTRDSTLHSLFQWTRSIDSCFRCMAISNSYSSWAGVQSVHLSEFIDQEAVEHSHKLVSSAPIDKLLCYEFNSQNIFELVKNLFIERFGVPTPDHNNKQHDYFARKLMISCIRYLNACSKLVDDSRFEKIIFVDSNDYFGAGLRSVILSSCCNTKDMQLSHRWISARWMDEISSIKFTDLKSNDTFLTDLIVSNLNNIRVDPKSWPREIKEVLSSLLLFIGLSNSDTTADAVSYRSAVGT